MSIQIQEAKHSTGFYKAKLYSNHSGNRVAKSANGGVSTMFPDSWSRRKVQSITNAGNLKSLATGLNPVPLN